MSPCHFYNRSSSQLASVFCVGNNGSLGDYYVYGMDGVRPVINIKSNVSITGKGTINSPYEIS